MNRKRKNNLLKFIGLLIFLFPLIYCTEEKKYFKVKNRQANFDSILFAVLEQVKKDTNQYVRMSDFTFFEWDKLYIYPAYFTMDSLTKYFPNYPNEFNYVYNNDSNFLMFFSNKDTIIQYSIIDEKKLCPHKLLRFTNKNNLILDKK